MSESLLTKKEAARLFRVSERTIDRYRAEGLLKALKPKGVVLFRESHLLAVIEKLSRKAG